MSCRHCWLLKDWHLNENAISARVPGNWTLRCGHCTQSLGGCRGDPGPTTEILWRDEGDVWFGAFYEASNLPLGLTEVERNKPRFGVGI